MFKNKKNYDSKLKIKEVSESTKEETALTDNEITFESLNLAEPIMRAIADAGYTVATPVQAKAIPLVLAGGDLLAGAQTGTGKTAAFTLPILHMLSEKPFTASRPGSPRCLILAPTRELAAQIEESVRAYGKYLKLKSTSIFGGVSFVPQMKALRRQLDILVATPGRLLDHTRQKTLDLSGVEIIVLDEADRMLDMGFIKDIKKIIALLPKQHQTLLFSATLSGEIKTLSDGLLRNPGLVEVAPSNTMSELVDQSVHLVQQNHKSYLLSHLIKLHNWRQVLVFTRTKHSANRLTEKLIIDGIPSAAIHSSKSQPARTKALAQFKNGSVLVLVATDIAARGLDIEQLPHVINFELPNVAKDYVHRIGRTGRAGSSGIAISLVDRGEMQYLRDIERLVKIDIPKLAFDKNFVPPANLPAEAPHVRQYPPHGRNRTNAPRTASSGTRNRNTVQRDGQSQRSNDTQQRDQQVRGNKQYVSKTRQHQDQPAERQNISGAVRQKARPQSSLFSSKSERGSRW